ncbi:hypothetical protein [Salinispora tropica]|uniref:Copper(I)-binding protein n=1 Tax=Salinispora tropica (strain ATCC BAA-916 / DSM 44818 / JCM 13857 / NBRC 105044 / CNB-440) TaxID=369723 RepID=A4XCN9_SALTO|nr:hypothetical protein [Salinispora tropica]ABP56696.1 hypothetical protein Strop_4268 [Salinispora tropica CNB-440]
MTRSIRGSHRSALLLAGLATSGLLLAGCSAGQVAETAGTVPSVQGVNVASDNGDFAIRSLLIAYPGVDGYQAGDDANLDVVLYNDSPDPVTVTVTTEDARDVVLIDPHAPLGEGSAVTPTQTESPGADAGLPPTSPPAGQPAQITVPPLSLVQLNSEASTVLRLIGLGKPLHVGEAIFVTFDFGGTTIRAAAPVSVPLSPATPPEPIIERHTGFEELEDGHGGEGGSGH